MSDIFISYAREDRAKAEELAHVFEQQGWTVWWDKVIPPGRKFADVISEEMNSAGAVLVLWSAASTASDWVKDEAQEGVTRGVLLPVMIEDVKIPYGFRQFQTCNLTDWDGSSEHPEMQSLLRELGRLIKTPRQAVVIPEPPPRPRASPGLTWRLPAITVGIALLSLVIGIVGYRTYYKNKYGPGGKDNRAGNATPTPAATATPAAPADDPARVAADHTARGTAEADKGNHRGAMLFYNMAIEAKRDYAPAYYYRAMSRATLGQNPLALADFRKVLELSPPEDLMLEAKQFIASIEAPPRPPNINRAAANANALSPPQVGSTGVAGDAPREQVAQMFSGDKNARIAATTGMIVARKRDPQAVLLAVKEAQAQPRNKSGVINTLVLLESVEPALLKRHKAEIEALLEAVKDNGPETTEHIKKVRDRLAS